MALKHLVLAALVAPALAHAQPPDAAPPDAAPPDAAPPQGAFEPPHAQGSTDVPYPAGAAAHADPIAVTVKLLVDATGTVQKADLVTPPQPPFDDAVIRAALAFRFDPATFDGKPVPVEITFTHTFLPPPPPPPPADTGPPRSSVLRGKLVQLGTRAPVGGATITAVVGDRRYEADAAPDGRFRLPLPAGPAKIVVTAPGHNAFLQQESLGADQELAVTYYVERDRYDPYEIVVVGEQRREVMSVHSLKGRELTEIPGTFGDPYRVIFALPGVAATMSLLPFPIVRGASPSSTGFLFDGTRVPLLFHLLSGPSVIHPTFIDEIKFYPGGAPVTYGGYTGGIIDGRTRRARRDEHLIDVDANLVQVGGLVRQPLGPVTVTAAGRYGYPGLLLSLATDTFSLSYWDYQLRVDGGTPRTGWTVFAFGASDTIKTPAPDADPEDPSPPLEPSLELGFHRLDLRYHRTDGRLVTTARTVVGRDRTRSPGTDFTLFAVEPQVELRWKRDESLTLVGGLEGSLRDVDQGSADPTESAGGMDAARLDKFYGGTALAEALWRPTPDWLIRPGVRTDVLDDGTTRKTSVDPRLMVRYVLGRRDLPDVKPDSDDSAIWLKGSAGVFHQPPRFILPLPGLDLLPLSYGLLRSYQTSLGTEVPLDRSFQLSAEGFFNYMDPTIFDLSINADSVITDANTTVIPPMTDVTPDGQEVFDRLTKPQHGRAYGLELLLRRQSKDGLFGWVSYTLSRSERLRSGRWVPYDFDRSHLVNVVAGLPLRRNWDLGVRLQYQSGKPQTTTAGYNEARTDGYLRFDVRIDKRAVWRSWLLDFYVDVTNAAVLPEEVTAGTVLRYVLPTLGVRGRF
jgi:TonB family protein